MLQYNPRHVSSINIPIFRRTNCIITASGIIALCKQLHSTLDESRLSLLSSGILYCTVTCPSSGGQIVLSQHLISSLSVNGCTVCRMRGDCSAVSSHSAYCTAVYRDTRCCDNAICPPEDGHVDARNMSRIVM